MELTTSPINTFTVMERYGIKSRTTLNDWLTRAEIKSFKQGKETFIHSFQLDALDAIARDMGRPINYSAGSETQTYEPVPHQPEIEQEAILTVPVDVLALAREFETLPTIAQWYAAYLIFDQLAASKIILPRKILLLLLGRKRLPQIKAGCFTWGNFTFYSADNRYQEWMVMKSEERR